MHVEQKKKWAKVLARVADPGFGYCLESCAAAAADRRRETACSSAISCSVGGASRSVAGIATVEPALLPILELLARGVEAAADACRLLLKGESLVMWDEALRIARPLRFRSRCRCCAFPIVVTRRTASCDVPHPI
jgi:hypothetical protein